MTAPAISFLDLFRLLLGRPATEDDVVVSLSTRLDEAGTDGRSRYAVVAGAISLPDAWDKLEASWQNLLDRSRVGAFHDVDFRQRTGDFTGWSEMKRKRFAAAQDKILGKQTLWEIAVAIDREAHAAVKKDMRGIKGLSHDTDCGLCFRVLIGLACEQAETRNKDFQMSFVIEAGPWAANASVIYNGIEASRGSPVPSLCANRMAGFAIVPKGVRRSLEAADYLAGAAQELAETGRLLNPGRSRMAAVVLDREQMQMWKQGVFNEKDRRRAFYHRDRPSGGQPA